MIYLNKFLEAQKDTFELALSEIKNGKKESHWMWYVFPQIQGLGESEISKFYSLIDIDEAKGYLAHPILGSRLIEISTLLLHLKENDSYEIFGYQDNLKLKSCMTLFSLAANDKILIFNEILIKYFGNEKCNETILIIDNGEHF